MLKFKPSTLDESFEDNHQGLLVITRFENKLSLFVIET